MQTLTRRHLVKLAATSSIATTATVLFGDSVPQPERSGSPPSKSGGFSPDLMAYATNGILTTFTKVHNNTATQEDMQAAASHAGLVANHLRDCGFDQFFTDKVSASDAATSGKSQLPDTDAYRKVLSQYVPDFDPTPVFQAVTASQSDVQSAHDQVSKVGLSGIFHSHADKLQRFSASFAPTPVSASAAPVSWSDGVYHPSLSKARLVTTQSCGSVNSVTTAKSVLQEVCDDVASATNVVATGLGIIFAACENNSSTFVFCGSLAARVAALGLELSVTGWVGLTVVAIAILLFILCGKI